jgi:sporulation protein YlmC with PRC-barrel domain
MRFSDLIGLEVKTESGEELGRVHDIRVQRDPRSSSEHAGQRWEVRGLVIGRRGLVERFGFPGASSPEPVGAKEVVPWRAIVRIREGTVVVGDGTKPE